MTPGRRAGSDGLGIRNSPGAWVEYFAYRAAVGGLSRMPDAWRQAAAELVAWGGIRFERRHTEPGRRYLAQALGNELDEREIEDLLVASWRHLVTVILENEAFNRRVLAGGKLLDHFEVELSDEAKAARDRGQGGFFVTPHVGMWEVMPAIAMGLGFRPGFVLARPPKNRPLSRFALRQREARGFAMIHPRGAVAAITAAIESGGWVGLLLDQRARGKAVIAPYFGKPVRCLRLGPALFRRLRRPVIFGACYRTARPFHYRLVADRVLWPEQLHGLGPEETATRINQELERLIRIAPDQYLWLHDRFQEWPPRSR